MLNPDVPIKTSSEDILNRKSFTDAMAKVILEYNYSEAFSIGIYGEWGSGKTSVINMIFEQIESNISSKDEKTIIIMKFNPWLCSDSKLMISQFFKQLSTNIKIKGQKLQKIASLIDTYSGLFDLANLIPAPIVGGALSTIGNFLKNTFAKSKIQKDDDLHTLKNQIAETLATENIRLIISIDDIDRLSEQEIISIFQLVKSLADFPNTMYILAFDYNIVVKALAKVQNGNGAEYLEKIVQFPLQLPSREAGNIHLILIEKLKNILNDSPKEKLDSFLWEELFYKGMGIYFTSIRNVNRYTNVFTLKYTLLKDETNILDLIALTCLQVFEPTIYAKLPFYSYNLCGAPSDSSSSNNDLNVFLENILSDSFIKSKDASHTLLTFLFPKLHQGKSSLVNDQRVFSNMVFLACQNIAHPDCFKRYFLLSLEKEAIPSSVIAHILYNADKDDILAKLRNLDSERKTVRFMTDVIAHISNNNEQTLSIPRAKLLLECIYIDWQNLQNYITDIYSKPLSWEFEILSNSLLKIISCSERFTILNELFNNKETSLEAIAMLLGALQISHNRFTEGNANKGNQLISLEEVIKLEEIYIQRYLIGLKEKTLLKHTNLLGMMQVAEEINPDLAKYDKKSLIDSIESLVDIIHACILHGRVIESVAKKSWAVRIAEIAKFIDINEAKSKLTKLTETKKFLDFDYELQEDIVAFLLIDETSNEKAEILSIDEDTVKQKLNSLIEAL